MVAKGRRILGGQRGEDHPNAKLDDEKVRAIRRRRASGELARTIAQDHGIDTSLVYLVEHRRIWEHVE